MSLLAQALYVRPVQI